MKRAATLLLFLTLTVAVAFAGQKPGNPQFVPVNIPGAVQTIVWSINNNGVMVGEYQDSTATHGFAAIGNQIFTIDVPGAIFTSCQDINSAGAIVGYYTCASCLFAKGFLYQNGKFTQIAPPNGSRTSVSVRGINDLGTIVGTVGASINHGFIFDGKTYQDLEAPGGTGGTVPTGINNSGIISLQWFDGAMQRHSSLYNGTNFKDIDVPGAFETFAWKINNLGDVAVYWQDHANLMHGALLKNGQYISVEDPGFNNTQPQGINDKDIIVGSSFDENGAQQGFKMIP